MCVHACVRACVCVYVAVYMCVCPVLYRHCTLCINSISNVATPSYEVVVYLGGTAIACCLIMPTCWRQWSLHRAIPRALLLNSSKGVN